MGEEKPVRKSAPDFGAKQNADQSTSSGKTTPQQTEIQNGDFAVAYVNVLRMMRVHERFVLAIVADSVAVCFSEKCGTLVTALHRAGKPDGVLPTL